MVAFFKAHLKIKLIFYYTTFATLCSDQVTSHPLRLSHTSLKINKILLNLPKSRIVVPPLFELVKSSMNTLRIAERG